MRASVLVSSYNYARFLKTAIDSALAQTYPEVEVIVVDDGSTDDSPRIIARYGSRLVSLFKPNGGQASALNAAVRASSGDVIVFLDSDDALYPHAIDRAVSALRAPGASKVHWNLNVCDPDGTIHPERVRSELSEGDLRDVVLRRGADGYTWPPTSGNAWTRAFVKEAFPIPEREFTTCPDFFWPPWLHCMALSGGFLSHSGSGGTTPSTRASITRSKTTFVQDSPDPSDASPHWSATRGPWVCASM